MDALLLKYPNVTRQELDKIRETSHYPAFDQFLFEDRVSSLHKSREEDRLCGWESVLVGPLVQLLSAQFLSLDQSKPLTVFGRIHAEFADPTTGEIIVHDFYNLDMGDAHVLESGGRLSLTNPDYSLDPFDSCMPLDRVKLVVDIYIGGNNLSAEFQCGDDLDVFEKVKVENITSQFGTLVLRYSAIPFAVQARVDVRFIRKQGYSQGNPPLNLNGKILACSNDIFGKYLLFYKKADEFERIDFDAATMHASMSLARSWVGISAHSPLIIDIDLSEYETGRCILKDSIKFQVRKNWYCSETFIVDDVLVDVNVAWYSPMPQGLCLDDESSDDEVSSNQEEESDDEQMSEACIPFVPSDFSRPWQMLQQDIPLSSCALQIYSVFIGREKLRPLQIYGSIRVSAPPRTYCVLIKEASNAYRLSVHRKMMPVQNGCGVFDDSETLKINLDLKDVSSELAIRGHVTWHWSSFNVSPRRMNKQLCSVVQGEDGFAAIHYSLFTEAVQAKVDLLWKRKDEGVHVPLMVFGSLVARYSNYDYTPRYNKDYYRVCLFERNREDPAREGMSGVISLARGVVVVPIGSSLVVEASLFDAVSNGGIVGTVEFRMGSCDPVILEGESHCIFAHIKWEEVGK